MDFRERRTTPTDHRLIRALEQPLAIRILEVARSEPEQRPSAAKLKDALADDFPGLETRQVAYHLARLQDVDLLPPHLMPGC